MSLSSDVKSISSKVTEALHWWPERGLKKQPATSTTTITENFETEVLGILTFMDVNSLACACRILGLVVPEQKKSNLKLLLKYIYKAVQF